MPIDLVKKSKKDLAINLKRQQVAYNRDKKSLEERLETRFSNLPALAYKKKVKVMWSVVLFFSAIIMIFWFYLASRGILFYTPYSKEKKDDFAKFSELTSGFKQLKNISIDKLFGNKELILNLKHRLEMSVAQSKVINKLKDNLQNNSVDFTEARIYNEESELKSNGLEDMSVAVFGNEQETDKADEGAKNSMEQDLTTWKEYKDIDDGFSFQYPNELNISEDLGQFIFRDQNPDGFSFYFFAIEPEIDNLDQWIQESSVSSDEEIIKYENRMFGATVAGIYYEAKAKKDDELKLKKDDIIGAQRSFGYIFNHSGATYLFRTNKENFQYTFNTVLNSIKLNSSYDKENY